MSPLEKRHDRTAFVCGENALNDFLRNSARQNQVENLSVKALQKLFAQQ